MANELNIVLAESGETVTCQPYQAGATVGSPISLTEIGTSAVYSGHMTGSAGTYLLAFHDGTENVGVGTIVWSGTAEVPVSTLTTGDLPSVPSVTDIRTELDANSTKLANLDATVSSRLAGSAYTAPTTAADIAAAVEGSLLNEADGQAVLNALVGAIGNTNLSEVSLVAAVRADLERNGGKLDSIPTTAAPSASAVASATRTELSTELSRIDQAISSRLASASYVAPTTPPTVVEIRQEIDANSTKLDAAVSTRLSSTAATDLAAVKAKTDLLNTDRLANVATTNIVGTLLAQANS